MVVFFAANLWAANAQTPNQLIATRVIGGLGGGVIEALGPAMISEMYVNKYLARALSVYTGFLAAGSGVGPLIGGYIGTDTGTWRWFFWVLSILTGVNFLTIILMLPETTALIPEADDLSRQDGLDIEEKATSEMVISNSDDIARNTESQNSLFQIWKSRSFYIRLEDIKPKKNWFVIFFEPLRLVLAPPILIAMLILSVTIAWIIITGTTVAVSYSIPPILWTSNKIGLLNIGTMLGYVLGIPFGGYLVDYALIRAYRKSDGIVAPEVRLPPLIPAAIISPLGGIIIGYALQNRASWVVLSVGWAMLGFGITAGCNGIQTYAMHSFPQYVGQIALLINIFKNTLGGGVSFVAVNWFFDSGALKVAGTMAGILWALYLMLIPIYFYGPGIRRWSTKFLY
jgi:MFS family permease